jgi:hypothetical protein
LRLDAEADLDGMSNGVEPDGMERGVEGGGMERGVEGGGILDADDDGPGADGADASAGQKPCVPLDFDGTNSSIATRCTQPLLANGSKAFLR